jgi:PAS domain-containing protein
LNKPARLRLDAEVRLQQGSTPPTQGWPLSSDALATLYRLASAPESAAEGLRLLHELQTHQVELDLQHEQLVANEREFVQDLDRYKALYDFAPVAYLIVDRSGHIVESNRACASLFGSAQDELNGSRFDSLIATQSRPALKGMLEKLNEERQHSFCIVHLPAVAIDARQLMLAASISPDSDVFLVVVSEYD